MCIRDRHHTTSLSQLSKLVIHILWAFFVGGDKIYSVWRFQHYLLSEKSGIYFLLMLFDELSRVLKKTEYIENFFLDHVLRSRLDLAVPVEFIVRIVFILSAGYFRTKSPWRKLSINLVLYCLTIVVARSNTYFWAECFNVWSWSKSRYSLIIWYHFVLLNRHFVLNVWKIWENGNVKITSNLNKLLKF